MKNGYANFDIDALDVRSNTLYEFYGDRWHGNPNVKHSNKEEAELLYNMTMERETILKLLGFKLITIWEDDWKHQMKSFTKEYRSSLIQTVKDNFIDTRKALHGGRTEVFKTYCECKSPGEVIMSFDISSQYPAVMALDNYAVGVNCRKKYTIEQLTKDILNDNFIGLVKCDIWCPKDIYVPVLPTNDRDTGRFIFYIGR